MPSISDLFCQDWFVFELSQYFGFKEWASFSLLSKLILKCFESIRLRTILPKQLIFERLVIKERIDLIEIVSFVCFDLKGHFLFFFFFCKWLFGCMIMNGKNEIIIVVFYLLCGCYSIWIWTFFFWFIIFCSCYFLHSSLSFIFKSHSKKLKKKTKKIQMNLEIID